MTDAPTRSCGTTPSSSAIAAADRNLKLTSDTFLALPYGIGMKQGNTALKRWVDSRLEVMRKRDTFNTILKNNVPATGVRGVPEEHPQAEQHVHATRRATRRLSARNGHWLLD